MKETLSVIIKGLSPVDLLKLTGMDFYKLIDDTYNLKNDAMIETLEMDSKFGSSCNEEGEEVTHIFVTITVWANHA